MMIKAVFFDVGETLIDESRDWNEWADHLEVPRRVFHALLGAVIARGQHHRRVFDLVRPGVDFAASCREREATGSTHAVTVKDLYPDVVPCLKRLRETGVLAGMVPVFLRRGPWAIIQSGSGRFASPVHAIDDLSALPVLLSGSLGT